MTYDELSELLRGRRVGRGRPGVARTGECWTFIGALDGHGYGIVTRAEFSGRAHRYVWLKVNGEIPEGMHVLHRCDNPACVRPSHLWLGTHRDNMQDMTRKGRGNTAGLAKGPEASSHVRMTEWTPEQRREAARHAAASRWRRTLSPKETS